MRVTRREFLCAGAALPLSASVGVIAGPINSVLIGKGKQKLAVYSDPKGQAESVLLTHFRRDVCCAAIGTRSVIAPAAERDLIAEPAAFWQAFEKDRYHDYAMRNSKVLAAPLPVTKVVRGGDKIDCDGIVIEVLETPGYTPGAVSYIFEAGGRRIACVGDLITGDGQLIDLWSLQDAVPEVKLRGYHGYAARAGELIRSLRLVGERRPDVLIPARGAAIERPQEAIGRLIDRLKAALREHFTTDALRWYFGDDRLRLRAGKLLEGEVPEWMPMAETQKLPDWALPIRNSRLMISATGAAFLVDCGYDQVIDELKRLQADGKFEKVEGIFITHYHDDHTDRAQKCAEHYQCPVYFSRELQEILEKPQAFRMPCLSPFPITSGKPQAEGARMRWHEFEFTFFYFPGQTLLHDALLVKRDGGGMILFVGDSFTPSGIDDYCLWNRDWLADGHGYFKCLEMIRKLPAECWLVNQHVEPMFRFSGDQLTYMEQSLRRRMTAMEPLFPWPDINFGLDEQWARLSPYEVRGEPGQVLELEAVVFNHARSAQDLLLRLHLPDGWKADRATYRLKLEAKTEGAVSMRITPAGAPARYIVTADVEFAGQRLGQWVEAVVTI
jgi:glyoxylase-like metal-dependent hydrolase (beta-lactamase superfamily II)